jgi:hypothetical protein
MLEPTKFAHPDQTVVAVATAILQHLKACRSEEFDGLKQYVVKTVHRSPTLFLPAVNLLFLLGLIEYRPKTDAFEYTGR